MRLFIRISQLTYVKNIIYKSLTPLPTVLFYSTQAKSKVENRNLMLKLQEILKIGTVDAINIITTHKVLVGVHPSKIEENYNQCIKQGIHHKTVLKCPGVLAEQTLQQKLSLLKTLPHPVNESLPLHQLSLKSLEKLCIQKRNRIEELSNFLKLSVPETCSIIAKKSFIITIKQEHIEESMKILVDNGIPFEIVVRDLWVLQYSINFIKSRLEFLNQHRVDNRKAWMIRCVENILIRRIQRESENKCILGDHSLVQYLSDRLCCSEEMAKSFLEKHPNLQKKSLTKLKEMLDMLYSHGFQPSHICRVPKILCHSTETTRKRLNELQILDVNNDFKLSDKLYLLTKSQKQYLQQCETLTKPKSKTGHIAPRLLATRQDEIETS